MILGFKTHWPSGKPTHFKEKILATTRPEYFHDYTPKIHTVRAGDRWPEPQRWQPVQLIHMATGVRTKNYQQFNEEEIIQGSTRNTNVRAVQRIQIWSDGEDSILLIGPGDAPFRSEAEKEKFAINDGFKSWAELLTWFFPKGSGDFSGIIIHFTDHFYPET